MATTTPMHGKLGAIYALRPNGFSGIGANDVTWGIVATDADSAYYTVEIDAEGTPDTFVWTVNGGGGAAGVPITGAAVNLQEDQTILHVGTDNHTLGDKWEIGNLFAEPCTVAGNTAQITDSTMRLLNPNAPPVWTWANSATVRLVSVDYTKGMATFYAPPGVTTVAGNLGWIPSTSLRKVAYLIDWNINVTLDMAEASRMGQQWKESLPGQAAASGGSSGYFIPTETMWNNLQDSINAGEKYFLLQLFTYDPDQDQTGDHWNVWVTFTGFTVSPTISEVVKESLNFQVFGQMSTIVDNV